MDSILEDLVDENSLDDNLVDTISEMFTDEHALDYSSPPLLDDYNDVFVSLDILSLQKLITKECILSEKCFSEFQGIRHVSASWIMLLGSRKNPLDSVSNDNGSL
ncbi:hypothetical protein Tco_0746326 [Tanacetum coccineum]